MKGLLRDNFYTVYANEKVFFVVVFLVGIVVAAVIPDAGNFIRNYMLICLVGFSYVALDSLRKDASCKWEKYKLIVPVTRADIVRTSYVGEVIWAIAGALFASVPVGLSVWIHGYPFDLSTDILLIYIIGISIDFFMGAVFFPLFYLRGGEGKEASLFISLISAVAAAVGLVYLLNYLFGPEMTSAMIVLSGFIILICAVLILGLSYFLTVGIFTKKE